MKYFSTRLSEDMFPEGSCEIRRSTVASDEVKKLELELCPCIKEEDESLVAMAMVKLGINIPTENRKASISLIHGDTIIVMDTHQVSLHSGEYTTKEISSVAFTFAKYIILKNEP